MCGRFAFYSPHEAIVRLFHVDEAPELEPRYNIAPTQYIAAVRADRNGGRSLSMLYWGLVPWWSKEKSGAAKLINARAETVRDKPSFRDAYRRRRCLILADGYYEWQRTTAVKQPWFIGLASGEPFGMAGLWDSWRNPADGERLESCTIVTTAPASSIAQIHDRMPVILPETGKLPRVCPLLIGAGPAPFFAYSSGLTNNDYLPGQPPSRYLIKTADGRPLLPAVLYRMQVTNALFPRVSGDCARRGASPTSSTIAACPIGGSGPTQDPDHGVIALVTRVLIQAVVRPGQRERRS
jgi:putative SOS response-associated peptidase YedK